MRKKLIFTFLFLAAWGGLAVANLLIPGKDFSENENRQLSMLPDFSVKSLLNGSYMTDMDTYVNDRFVLRDEWICAMSMSEYILGKRESNGVLIGNNALFSCISPSDKYIDNNLAGIESFASCSGLDCYFALVPSAAGVQGDRLPQFAQVADENALIDSAYRSVGVKSVDLFGALSEHSDEYIFYRTDHHWTTYGAYLAYVEICEKMGIASAQYAAEKVSDSFNGTLFSRSGVRFVESDVIESFICTESAVLSVFDGSATTGYENIYFTEFLDKKDKYSYFLGTNQPIETIRREGGGKKLLMFRDSYASCLAPMLLSEFDTITLVDMRYINTSLDELVDVSEYDTALFMYSTDVFISQPVTSKLKEANNEEK